MPEDAHSRPSGDAPEALYDLDVATPSHGEQARTLAAGAKTATLATVGRDPAGYPYGSFVTVAFDAGRPVLLLSQLAEHTKNLHGDSRASILVAESRAEDPLANGRVTLLGRCQAVPADETTARGAYLEAHPNASYYADFKDFAFWRLEVESIRYIGGYGRMSWVAVEDWLGAEPDPLASDAAGIVEHMNDDHGDALAVYCRAFSKARDAKQASMTAIDRYGFELSVVTADGPRPVRLAFPEPLVTAADARQALIAMLKQAREQLGEA